MKYISHTFRRFAEWSYYKMSGSPRYDYWKMLEETQYLSREKLAELQRLRLNKLIRFAYDHNPFYRNRLDAANVRPDDIRKPEDLKKLPILTKADVRTHIDEMISDGFDRERLLKFKTGGSTGKALELYLSETCSEIRNALARRNDRWSGWEVGEPVGAIWGNPVYPKGLRKKIIGWILTPFIYLDTMAVSAESVKEFARQWREAEPTLIFGHAHSIFILAQHLEALGITDIRPKGIISSSMMLLPHERVLIEKIFAVKVTDRYGCEEVSLIASECEMHDGMHINQEHLVVEFLKDDGTDAAPGEPGHIIVTDLMNRAMPFIRYRVEDMGVFTQRQCPCGRGLPLMEKVAGRVADFLIREDGSKIAGISLIENTLTKLPGLDQMQIIQETASQLVLNIVPSSQFTNVIKIELQHYFQSIFGHSTDIQFNIVNSIAPEPSGKYRFSICRIQN